MARAEKSTSTLPVRAPAAERVSQRASTPVIDDHRPRAVAQRHLLEAIDRSPRATSQRGHIEGLVGAGTAQRSSDEEEPLQGRFAPGGRAERQVGGASAANRTGLPDKLTSGIESLSGFSRDHVKVHHDSAEPAQLEAPAPAQLAPAGVVQRDKRVVAGVDVDTDGGYTNWEGWHINWRLGSKKNGVEQFHLTSQDRTQHYFFIIDGGELKDTKPPAKLKPKRGTVGGLSAAPSAVQTFVRTNIDQLLP